MSVIITRFFLLAILLQTLSNGIRSETTRYDERIVDCIPVLNPGRDTLAEYNNLQIVTDLIHLPLGEIAKRQTVSEKNVNYNRFLACSWMKYEYLTRQGEIVFDNIEMALREALTREVGITDPEINLSNVQAKRIVQHCQDITAITPGLKVVKVQNCILKQIEHLGKE